ncbi:hypothetical protein [Candidatus Formimonas warabiya]|uniref:WG repeat-containing protein n=1 Tax=Formimonas warabiya TaxID=1761012 RepID=A0A3G1KTG7_FORW1|nr:hypothetical protein [Candidatus Formimonas warabiya]ATW25758.1 hypothetical protein DCMF_14190 [Candidatus Formimonas warabiya]
MAINYSVRQGVLTVNGHTVSFSFPVRTVKEMDCLLVVLLAIPFDRLVYDNVYAVDSQGEILWQIQNAQEIFPGKNRLPYENMMIREGKIVVSDFYGARFFVNPANGEIIGRDQVK